MKKVKKWLISYRRKSENGILSSTHETGDRGRGSRCLQRFFLDLLPEHEARDTRDCECVSKGEMRNTLVLVFGTGALSLVGRGRVIGGVCAPHIYTANPFYSRTTSQSVVLSKQRITPSWKHRCTTPFSCYVIETFFKSTHSMTSSKIANSGSDGKGAGIKERGGGAKIKYQGNFAIVRIFLV